jgi:hypothetical protein
VESEIDTMVGIPQDMPEGNYELYLNLPDPEEALYTNPAYAIRLANEMVWEENTGYNKLNILIQIDSKNKGENYTGNLFFQKN